MANENGNKKSLNKYEKLVLFITVINLFLTMGNIYLIYQTNEIRKANLELQETMYSFTSVIIADADYANLGTPSEYSIYDNTTQKTVHYGYLEVNLQVITPHYGKISIRLRSFNVGESYMLDSEKRNETKLSYAHEGDKYEYPVVQGLNQINDQLHLKALVYPNPQYIPPYGEPVQFILGLLKLEAELFDIQTEKTSTKEFSAPITVSMEALP